jgi:hypothetical protein
MESILPDNPAECAGMICYIFPGIYFSFHILVFERAGHYTVKISPAILRAGDILK